jgi:3D (Asp-Asp-Asp) domain-containing protein
MMWVRIPSGAFSIADSYQLVKFYFSKMRVRFSPGISFMRVLLICILLTGFTGDFSDYKATAYSLKSKMSCGQHPKRGIIAADPRFLKHGTNVEITGAGKYSGRYRVCDTGVKGRNLDIWVESKKAALTFGRKSVKLRVVKL